MSHGTLQIRYACLCTDDLSLPELKLFTESLFNCSLSSFYPPSQIPGFLIRKRLLDSQTDGLVKSSLLLRASTRLLLQLLTRPCPTSPAGETDEGGESLQDELESSPRVEISNMQFMLTNPFRIHTVCKQ